MAELDPDITLLTPDVELEDKVIDTDPDEDVAIPGADDDNDEIDESEEDKDDEIDESEEDNHKENIDNKFPLSTRPTITDISKAYPNFFKRFPSMRDVVFREREFTTIFPTVNDAKDAVESSMALTDFRDDLFLGNGEKFTAALKEAGELQKFSSNFITNLQKTDSSLYWEAMTPTFENLIKAFYREGTKRGDDSIKASAENLSIFLFDTAEVAEGKKSFIKEQPKADPKMELEKADWEREKFNNFNISVTENCFTGIKSEIKMNVPNLTKTMKELITSQIIKEVDNVISKDTTHMKYVDSLWSKAS